MRPRAVLRAHSVLARIKPGTVALKIPKKQLPQ
jgi:hypothetical protein